MNYVELVKRLEDSDLVELHNRYCDEMIAPDNEISANDSEFLDLFQEGNDAHWLACRVFYGDYNPLHNRYCDEMIAPDNEISANDSEFLDLFQEGNDAHWLACRVFYGDYNPCHDWVAVNGYGNLVSSDYPSDLMSYSYEELARFLENNPDVIDELGLDVYIEE